MKPHCAFVVLSKLNLVLAFVFTLEDNLVRGSTSPNMALYPLPVKFLEKSGHGMPCCLRINRLRALLPPPLFSEKLDFYTQVYHFIMNSTLCIFFIIRCYACLILEKLYDFLSNLHDYIFRLAWWVSTIFSLWCSEVHDWAAILTPRIYLLVDNWEITFSFIGDSGCWVGWVDSNHMF